MRSKCERMPGLLIAAALSVAVLLSCSDNSNPTDPSSPTPISCRIVEVTPDHGQPPLTVSFRAVASGGAAPYSFLWSFGDGATSANQNPSHSFSSAGTYTVTVTASDSQNGQSTADTVVSVSGAGQGADLVLHPGTPLSAVTQTQVGGIINIKVGTVKNEGQAAAGTFGIGLYLSTDSTLSKLDTRVRQLQVASLAAGAEYMWGEQIITLPPSVTAGTYYVGIWADDDNAVSESNESNNQASAKVTVLPASSELTCSASATPTSGNIPLTVNFTGGASGGQTPYTYSWQFGDGQTSTLQSPSHVYQSAGTYTSVLTVKDAQNATCTKSTTVTSSALTLNCTASATPAAGIAPLQVSFNLGATGGTSPYSYHWNFGDQSSSNSANPAHTYSSSGVYTATGTVTDAQGATCSKQVTISVAMPGLSCTASANPTSGAAPLQVSFTGSASSGVAPYHYVWIIDGKDTLLTQNATYTFQRSGTYPVIFGAVDSRGEACSKQLTIVVSPGSSLSCSATASPTSGIAPLNVAFTASATGGLPPYTYSWQFGDGQSSSAQNPTHLYQNPGTYTSVLTVKDAQNVTCTKSVSVTANTPTLGCNAAANTTNGIAPLTVNFSGGASGGQPPYTYSWQFGDGQTSTLQSPSHVYQSAGTYTSALTVKDAQNTTCAKSIIITVSAPTLSCTATASPLAGVKPLAVTFGAAASGGTSPYSYSWNFGDGATSSSQNPVHTYQSAGAFNAVLTVTDAHAVVSKDTVQVTVSEAASGPVLSGPSTSAGTFTLSWTFSWPPLMNSNDKVSVEQKIGTGAYSEIAQVMRSSGSQIQLTRAVGTYTYRVRAYYSVGGSSAWSAYSNEVTVQVTAPSSKTRFINNSTYFIVSLKVDNVEQFPSSPLGLMPGYYYEMELSPGVHMYEALYGFWNEYGGMEYLYRFYGDYTQGSGVTEKVTFTSPSISQLLTKFEASGTWSAWVPGYFNKVVFKFSKDGTFSFTNLSGQTSTGNYSFISRNATSWTVTFSIGSYQGVLYEFLGYFVMYNGPGNAALQYFYDGL